MNDEEFTPEGFASNLEFQKLLTDNDLVIATGMDGDDEIMVTNRGVMIAMGLLVNIAQQRPEEFLRMVQIANSVL